MRWKSRAGRNRGEIRSRIFFALFPHYCEDIHEWVWLEYVRVTYIWSSFGEWDILRCVSAKKGEEA